MLTTGKIKGSIYMRANLSIARITLAESSLMKLFTIYAEASRGRYRKPSELHQLHSRNKVMKNYTLQFPLLQIQLFRLRVVDKLLFKKRSESVAS